MSTIDREEFFRRAAAEYAESYGEALRRELLDMEKSGAIPVTPGLDRRVRRAIGREKFARHSRWISLVAAGLALAVIVPGMLRLREKSIAVPEATQQAASSAAPAAAAEEPAPEEEAQEEADYAVMDDAIQEGAGLAGGTRAELEPIPLSFALPQNFSVAAFELDNGKSVYTLANTGLDDVVMTLEYTEPGISFGGFTEITIGDHITYGRSTPDYSLLAFEKQDVVYTLSCRHDINTLVDLSKNILADV